ncbi:ataxin-1 [Boleophthalmus pectinirostris]|uniref:ataxin-1 n=1 Tax=Boleophthalmus pectinirostris TaxID=150288 RepID=UPI000A1C1EA5|nr:ataxin-1 [Boleophthalmus pectinirostris]XP_055021481.1 ataxin-1 [Boleophthalmus pectinirostris]XP_055021482.1 ataxin-1 [Boleophthalmus pectinirostris]XP_055021483.1 ataxin-1 [Boleophthalmus pectinirostris]XP_055021484.1 ataxin-1 [Boleophthalmus pectinirostris]XP_055021485.1 ataxin-1 [Boleophthalmus pectinirostris]XP_055021486.1 ataxin-1 [Boleophthalmus pectinirostris]XP_055021487.1 ataxin-1 [Boleophthalmus pectinirostris]XP_055021488.1 ataxin-1 [Boleophthalmus pectinirostris]XP_05502148
MNPSPERGKECLPPKKRESRQGSSDLPLDEFKPPVPLRVRPSTGRGEGAREASDRVLTNPNSHLLHTPPPLPTPAPSLPLPLPWHLGYSPSVSLPLFSGQVERRGAGSPAWRDDPLTSTLPHHSRWNRGEGLLSLPPPPSSSSSSFKAPFPADSREMWSYMNSGRRDYSSSLFPPSYLFGHHSLYSQDTALADPRHRYAGKRPNGLDGPGSRTATSSKPLLGEYGNDSSRLDISPHSTHTNGARRHQENLSSLCPSAGLFLSDSAAQEEPHSSLQDTHGHAHVHSHGQTHGHAHALVKSSSSLLSPSGHPLGADTRVGRGDLLDPLGVSTAEAQVYYSLGMSQNYPLYSPSGTPLYNLHRDPGPRQHAVRSTPHSPLGVSNNHERPQRDREQERDRDRSKDKDKHLPQHRDQQRDSEPERRRDRARGRDLSPGRAHSSPPALLPHFTKGSLIELAGGRLKRVEELRTEDFLRSADTSPDLHLSTCKVLLISPSSTHGFSHMQVHLTDRNTQELLKVLVEYPFFVRDRGWSSCCPQKTLQLYGLSCRQLSEGDVCLALTPTPTPTHRARPRPHRTQSSSSSSRTHREDMPPPPPPPPLPHHTPTTVPPPTPRSLVTSETDSRGQSRPRKRRWSAPDTFPSTGTEKSVLDLPQGSKLMKWQ